VTVGEALTEARYRAGLTVDEVSERTRIREAVIRCIERDDYDACGGDLYARGYVRAIAGAVGIDAQPLIREFDAGRASASVDARRAPAQEPVAAPADPPLTTADPALTIADPGFKAADPALTIADPGFTLDPGFRLSDPALTIADPGFRLPGQDAGFPPADPDPGYMTAEPVYRIADRTFTSADNPFTAFDEAFTAAGPAFPAGPPALTAGGTPTIVDPFVIDPEQVFPASAPIYVRPANPSAWRGRTHSRRWVTGVLLLVALAATLAIVAGGHIIAGLRHTPAANNSASAARTAQPGTNGGTGAKTAPGGTKASKAPPKARKPAQKKRHRVSAPPVRELPIALAAAFGPDGTADGDNPHSAPFAVSPRSPLPWQTDWYASPRFGMLKDGTGLLLDMRRSVTITSVRIVLSPYRGANLQLRAGGSAARLRVVARASDTGGTVRLRLAAPVRARYLLIWFTLLPPNGQGRYQESIHGVVVNGHR
jgi:helix-turn-helix protein